MPTKVTKLKEGEELRYTYTGTVSHVIDVFRYPSPSSAVALCGRIAHYPWEWLGTGSQDEIDKAKKLRICRYCTKVISSRGVVISGRS